MAAYRWKTGSRFGVSVETAVSVMQELTEKDELTPAKLVDVSRPEDAPLHKVFEWNDNRAAELWRCQQARTLINHIEVVYDDAPNAAPVPMFVQVMQVTNKQIPYKETRVLMRSREGRDAVVAMALGEAKAFENKYARLTELSGIFAAIHEAQEEYGE